MGNERHRGRSSEYTATFSRHEPRRAAHRRVCGKVASDVAAEVYALDLNNPTEIYRTAERLERDDPDRLLPFFEHAEQVAASREEQRFLQMYEVPRHPHLGSPMTPFPYTGAIIDAVTETVKRAMAAAHAFYRGFLAGAGESLNADAGLKDRLRENLLDSYLINVVFPFIFTGGAAVGIVEDMAEAVKGIYVLITDFKRIMKATVKLVKAILEDETVAYEIGKLIGGEVADDIKQISHYGAVRFTFELGRVVGPLIVYSVLAFYGGVMLVGLRVIKDFVKVLNKVPRLSKLLAALAALLPKKSMKLVRVGRWMSVDELNKMKTTGMVQPSTSGGHVDILVKGPKGFEKQAKVGQVYVEFDVPEFTVKPRPNNAEGWARLLMPDSPEGKLAKKKGLPIPELPAAKNIEMIKKKTSY